MGVVQLNGIAKHFGDVYAVNGVDLKIEEGEFLVILGPSGCGKTTLMRMIAGLELPTQGNIQIGGRDVTDLPPRLRGSAMVFQSYALYPHMTVFDNIAFPLRSRRGADKLTADEITHKVTHTATLLEIQAYLKRRPRQLSGGQRQRVAIARAMVTQPQVLLLDEPLSNLDAKLRASARDELKDFQREFNITTIFVTHDQIEAMGLGDRIVVMAAGKIQQVGTPIEIYKDPANTFVARFLGSPSMNILQRDDFDYGFRPESFMPKTVMNEDVPMYEFQYHVKRVEYLGADRVIYGHLEGYSEIILTLAKLPDNVRVKIEPHQHYTFTVPKADVKYFDRQSGERIEGKSL